MQRAVFALKRVWAGGCCALCLAAATGRGTQTWPVDIERYQVIIDRMPFGEPPPVRAAPVKPVPTTPPPQSFINNLRMCGITETEYGVRVGLVDTKSKPLKSYFLYLGESQDGIELMEADYEREGALLAKDGEQYWIYMSGPPTTAAAAPAGVAARGTRAATETPDRRPRRTSYAQRLRERREAEAARLKEETMNRVSGEELVKKLQEYQLDVIRKGMPPLPIPLTKEMDDKLVSEGVLPPLE